MINISVDILNQYIEEVTLLSKTRESFITNQVRILELNEVITKQLKEIKDNYEDET